MNQKMKGQVHPGYIFSVLKPAFSAMAGESPHGSGLTKESRAFKSSVHLEPGAR